MKAPRYRNVTRRGAARLVGRTIAAVHGERVVTHSGRAVYAIASIELDDGSRVAFVDHATDAGITAIAAVAWKWKGGLR